MELSSPRAMDPEVAAVIPDLVRAGLLDPQRAAPLLREARGDRISLRLELRAALYLGVTLVVAGVSVLVRANLERIGPATIAIALGLAALGALVWVGRHAPPFGWDERPSPHLAFDYVLLLGLLLGAADLAYVEVSFAALGEHWPWHLLIVALAMGAAAVRWDSRLVAGLALSSFAAWRGVSVAGLADHAFIGARVPELRWNAIGCGLAFVALGAVLKRRRRKPHFEPVAVHLGWLLALGGVAGGAFASGAEGVTWALGLLVAGGLLALHAYRGRRFALFALAAFAVYVGASRIAIDAVHDLVFGCGWFALSGLAMVVLLWRVHRSLRGSDEA